MPPTSLASRLESPLLYARTKSGTETSADVTPPTSEEKALRDEISMQTKTVREKKRRRGPLLPPNDIQKGREEDDQNGTAQSSLVPIANLNPCKHSLSSDFLRAFSSLLGSDGSLLPFWFLDN